jgi:hypothetical protein
MALRTEFRIVRGEYGECAVARALFSAFLDTGAVDALVGAPVPPVSPRTDTRVGAEIRRRRAKEIRQAFLEWVAGNPLAEYMCRDAETLVLDVFDHYVTGPRDTAQFLDKIVGARHRALAGEEREKMPADVLKSFTVRARSLVSKFAAQYAAGGIPKGVKGPDGKYITLSVEKWVVVTLSRRGIDTHMPSEHLRALQRLYKKYSKYGDVTSAMEDLLRHAAVEEVMGS